MNLARNLERSAFYFPDRPALSEGSSEISYRQFNESANRMATALIGMGIRPGDKVGLCAPNSSEWLITYFGILKAGAVAVTLSSQVGSVFPHSFGLIVSINVVSLVIIGGSGSIPGVIVGSLVLVGLPELLREFSEYRLLIYGALLVVMMLVKPEGFWPSEVRKRELQDEMEPVPVG